MNTWRYAAVIGVIGWGCGSSASLRRIDQVHNEATQPAPGDIDAPKSADVTRPISRASVISLAVAYNPGLAAMAHRARAIVLGAKADASLPSPELGLEIWNVPLARPYAIGDAAMYMVELRQRFPALGARDARARATADDAHAVIAELASEERLTAQRAADAYAEYVRNVRDHAIHHAHLQLLEQMQGAVRARLTTGGSGIADAARIDLELAKTRRAITRIDGDIASARATINALLRRPADAPLGQPTDLDAMTVDISATELIARSRESRGSYRAARDRIRAARARHEAASAEARWPELMLGLGYWHDPHLRPGIGLNVSLSLPWLWGGKRDRVAQAREQAAAEAAALDAVALEAQREITQAHARIVAAERELAVLHVQALPAARRTIEAIRAIYPTSSVSLLEWIDAARSFLDLEMEETAIAAELARAVAALERAVGTPLQLTAVTLGGSP